MAARRMGRGHHAMPPHGSHASELDISLLHHHMFVHGSSMPASCFSPLLLLPCALPPLYMSCCAVIDRMGAVKYQSATVTGSGDYTLVIDAQSRLAVYSGSTCQWRSVGLTGTGPC